MNELFRKYAARVAEAVGTSAAFLTALAVIVGWAATGPLFHFSDTWQLVINTSTTIVTFLMVFLIQNTQNRDAKAIHLKLDELIRALEGARNNMIDLENLSDSELEELHRQFLIVATTTVTSQDRQPTSPGSAPNAPLLPKTAVAELQRCDSHGAGRGAQQAASAVAHELKKRGSHRHSHKR